MDQQTQQGAEAQIDLAEIDVSINDRTSEYYEQEYDSRFKFDASKYGTKQGAEIAEINFGSRREGYISGKGIKNAQLAVKSAVQLTEQNYVTQPTPENRIKYAEALGLQDTEDGVKFKLNQADIAAAKLTKANDIGIATQAGLTAWTSTVTKDDPDGDLNAGFDLINGSDLPAEDKPKAETAYKTMVTNRRAEAKLELEERQEDDRGGITDLMYVKKDYTATQAAILASSLPEKEQASKLKENEDRARLAARGGDEIDDPIAVDNVSTAISRVGSDRMSLKDAKKILADNQSSLKSTTAAQAWKDINEEFDKSTGTAYSRVRADTKQKAIGKSQSALDVLLEALTGATPKTRGKLEEQITTARTKFNLELENFNRWEASMRDWRRKNADAEPEAIQREGIRSWSNNFSGLSTEQLRTRSETEKTKLRDEARDAKSGKAKKATKKTKKAPFPVKVQRPDGKTGTIMSDRLDELPEGWKRL